MTAFQAVEMGSIPITRSTRALDARRISIRISLFGILIDPHIGVWLSWLERLLWEQEVAGSSPATPTTIRTSDRLYLYLLSFLILRMLFIRDH